MVSDNATDRKIRLGEVASALNLSPKLIRNWTANDKFDLIALPNRVAEKWREYSYLDVAHLAIAAQAIRYGFSIGEAHDFAGAALVRVLGDIARIPGALARAPGGVIEAICRGKNLYLVKLSDGEAVSLITPFENMPRYHGAVHIDLEMCVHVAFSGLKELGHDAFSSSHPKEYTDEEAVELEATFKDFSEKHQVNPNSNVARQSDISARGPKAPARKKGK